MAKRKNITKKVRFEVFKRDSFKCQYCGKTSPDVTLEVDHIKPVAEGGDNDITNLLTACFDCNRGKSDKLLDDKSVLEKQRKQLEELNERRNQLEMMMEWREGISSIEDDKLEIFMQKWNEETGYSINEVGEKSLKKWMKKIDFNTLLDCMEISINQYLIFDRKGEVTHESVEKTFKMIPRIAANKEKNEQKPYMKDLYYIRGIVKNRLSYHDPMKAIKYLELAHVECGYSIESLKELALTAKNWTEFRNELEDVLEGEGVEY